MNPKRYVFVALLLSLLIFLLSPAALADLNIIETPPTDAGAVPVGDTLALVFQISYSGSTDSRAAISIGFDASGWTYTGFTAMMDAVDVSAGFTETVSAGTAHLTNNALEPDEGTLTVVLIFTATAEGTYTFDWSSAFSIISGTNPDLQTAIGTTNAIVFRVTVTASADWDEPTDTVDITAIAECSICETITSGTVTYEIFTAGDVSTGITGPMMYNAVTSRWEALDVDTSTLIEEDYYALVNVTDPDGHSGTGQASFTIMRVPPYTVIITTSGLSSPLYTTHVYVDDVDQGGPYLWDGQSRDFVFDEGETPTISVDKYVADGVGTRYHCEVNSWTTAPSGDQTHTFRYITQHLLTLSTNFGTVSASPTSPDGYYDAGTTVEITATPPSAIEGERYLWNGWMGTGEGSYTTLDNPASVTMNSPITETASWTHQYHLTVSTNPLGLVPAPIVTPPDLWYNVDTRVTCTAQDVADYKFIHWTVDDVSRGEDVKTIPVTMNAPHKAIAHYIPILPDFTISVEPTRGTVVQGASTTATATVTSIAGYSEIVTLSASDQPAGVSIDFDPESGTPTFASSMTIDVGRDVESGTYIITITGTGADTTVHTTTYKLKVTALQPLVRPVGGFRILTPLDTIRELAPWIILAVVAVAFIAVSIEVRRKQ